MNCAPLSPCIEALAAIGLSVLALAIAAYLMRLAVKGEKLPKLVLLICLAFASTANAATFSTLRSDCRVLVRDTGTTRNRFTDAQINRFLNEGQRDVIQYAKPIRKVHSFELVSGTTYYATPSDYLSMERLTRSYQVLQEQSVKALDKQLNWQTVGGLPIVYFINHSSRSLVGFYPFPNSTSSTGTIRMEYNASATDLSSDSDEAFNGIDELQPYAYLTTLYCGYRAALVESMTTQAQAYYAEYKRGSDMLASDAFSRPNYRPGAIGATPGGP